MMVYLKETTIYGNFMKLRCFYSILLSLQALRFRRKKTSDKLFKKGLITIGFRIWLTLTVRDGRTPRLGLLGSSLLCIRFIPLSLFYL